MPGTLPFRPLVPTSPTTVPTVPGLRVVGSEERPLIGKLQLHQFLTTKGKETPRASLFQTLFNQPCSAGKDSKQKNWFLSVYLGCYSTTRCGAGAENCLPLHRTDVVVCRGSPPRGKPAAATPHGRSKPADTRCPAQPTPQKPAASRPRADRRGRWPCGSAVTSCVGSPSGG